ncbi:MAG: hypothetical protein CME62_09985 [Halobacteriovoraceae bacterium]|nr:hypothetical protein [Halobacteriovoraceae bacterium]|tara:strand:+ start:8377 stop:8997 length:621 start_codon:yes stop_codon:yes gene_type:complete
MKKLTYFFDLLSPFSFFAWINHSRLKDVELDYKPVLMGSLFSYFDFKGPGEIKVKRNYELKKAFRYAFKNQIDFKPPRVFPFNPLAIDRCATLSAAGVHQKQVIDLLFKKIWQESMVLDDPEKIKQVLSEAQLPPEIFEKAFAREAKQELKQNIKLAQEHNIFGVPTFLVGEEYFWGNDSLEDLENYLQGRDNFNRDYYNELISES